MYVGNALAVAVSLPMVANATNETPSASPAITAQAAQADGVQILRINPTTVELSFANHRRVAVDFYGENIFRIFEDHNGGVMRAPEAKPEAHILVDNPRTKVGSLQITEQGDEITLASSKAKVIFNKTTGLFKIVNAENGKTVATQSAPSTFTPEKVTLTLQEQPDEYYFGGGVQNGRFSHKGEKIEIVNTNNWVDGGVASPAPFYWSTAGYGFMWYTFKPGLYDFGSTQKGSVKLSHESKNLDVFFMVGEKPTDLLGEYYQLTGNPVLLPKFGFYEGHLNAYNRDYWKEADKGRIMTFEDGKSYKESASDKTGIKDSINGEKNYYQFSARAAIDRYVTHDMPLGWFLPNDGYGAGYGQESTLDGNIENLKQFGDYARKHGVEIGLWTQSDLHPKDSIEALLQRDIVKEVRDAGVRVLKTDVAWVGYGYSFGLNGVADVAQVMPYYGSNARPFIITLDGWAGAQRYATVWSGDQTGGDWEYIRFHIPTFIGSGLSGQPNITSDMDGIFGGKNVPVNVREFQWKTFTPMQLNMDGWGANPKYPHILGEPATSINRSYLKLKSMLMPYAYTIAHEAIDGKPMIRAMFLDYPIDYTHGTKTEYQFMFGPSMLIAPIYKETRADKEGNDIRNGIYLPEGTWIDYWNGDAYKGGRIINEYDTPLWKIPVFVKADAIIPMTNPNNNPSQIRQDYRAYEIYASANGTSAFKEYDDDGNTTEYLHGDGVTTDVSVCTDGKGRMLVDIDRSLGMYDGYEAEKQTELRGNVTRAPKKVTVKVGKTNVKLTAVQSLADFEKGDNVYFYDAEPNLNRFSTPGTDAAKVVIKKNPQLLVKIQKTNVKDNAIAVAIDGFEFNTSGRKLTHNGALAAPEAQIAKDGCGVFVLTPSWKQQANADYYEIEYDGMVYSTIRGTQFAIDQLQPETEYTMKVRAVNRDGASDWTTVKGKTLNNPLEFAIKGIKAQTSFQDQPGQKIAKMFDFDKKTSWHSQWGKGEAIPGDVTIDLRSVNKLDRIEYIPREDAGNGTIMEGTISYSMDRQKWSTPVPFVWKADNTTKTFAFEGNPEARYVQMHLTKAVGNFASGRAMYIYKVAGSQSVLQGDINHDNRIDENDLTSYMNYTGLRRGDSDFDYVSAGDINQNTLIAAYAHT